MADTVHNAARLGPQRARERFYVFADESATSPTYPCYGIGALVVPASRLDRFNAHVGKKLAEHGVVGEARWTKVATSHGLMNFAIELWRDVLNHPAVRFGAIVVHKEKYLKWHVDREDAFYTTYTFLLRHVARLRAGDFEVAIDDRSDSYDKRDEVLGIVSNHMLRNLNIDSEIVRVTKDDSKLVLGLQVTDLFTGAITHAHAMGLDLKCTPNAAKQLLMRRMAEAVEWPDLYCDTMPDSVTNIWHFPKEWRAKPETRRVSPKRAVSFISAGELAAARG
jgi:Protein of unknown function (DUF3800)